MDTPSRTNSKLVCLDPCDLAVAIEAIRRDMRRERELALLDPVWQQWHEWNARQDLTLLEAINPKHTRPFKSSHIDALARDEGCLGVADVEL